MLVPHEPKLDPRVGWVIDLCRGIGRTEVIAATWGSGEPAKEYDGTVSIERFDIGLGAARLAQRLSKVGTRIGSHRVSLEFSARQGRPPRRRFSIARARHHAGGVARWAAAWSSYGLLVTALYRRARAVSVHPQVVIAHDIYGLIPAALLKSRWRAAVIYDSHEYTAEGDLIAPKWQTRLTRLVERAFIRRADKVITVSPPLAKQLERDFGLRHVLSVANAEPASAATEDEPRLSADGVVRFLLQGQAAPGRGFERLFELWQTIDEERAQLLVRCPDGEYPAELRDRFSELFASGRAVWLPPVREDELVSAATAADVGVIPYLGPNRNHVYACPNKLSQYMAAGLAILSNKLQYVGEMIDRYDCGAVYDATDERSFRHAVRYLTGDDARLLTMRRNALEAARAEFNWERVSVPYAKTIGELMLGSTG